MNVVQYLGSEIREIIINAHKIMKHPCSTCKGTGITNWDENGNDEQAGPTNDIERAWGYCDECDGVGYDLTKR